MVQLLTETLIEDAQAALAADHLERDREAWNLPQAPVTVSPGVHRDGLDWDGFRDLYYPDSRRHNFEAIVAYSAYKKSTHAGWRANEATPMKGDASLPEALSLDKWADEGGTSP